MRTRAAELRRKSYAELAALPEWSMEYLKLLGEEVHLSTHRIARSSDELLVVVQAARERLFGMFTETRAEGFLANSAGEHIDAPEELLWDYI